MSKEIEFIGKTAVITGTAAGIGLSGAENFAQAGTNAILVDIEEEKGKFEAKRLTDEGYKATFFKADVTDGVQVSEVVAETMLRFSHIDILVNNAGGFLQPSPWWKSLRMNGTR